MAAVAALPVWVQGIRDFQRLALVNKAVMDVTAVDIPFIALAKNKTEQKERIFRQVLVLLAAFILAPIHATMLARYMSKHVGTASKELNKTLMQLSYKDLTNVPAFQAAAQQLLKPTELAALLPKSHLTEALRLNVIKAKSRFLQADLAVEGFFFATIGPLKALFGQWLMGNKQFTGEKGLAKQSTLDKLYEAQTQKKQQLSPILRFLDRYKTPFSIGLGMVVPVLFGRVLHRSFLAANPSKLYRWLKQTAAPHFDYHYASVTGMFKGALKGVKHIPFLSDGSMMLIVLLMHAGELTVMRSPRELKEYIVQRVPLDITFFLGIPAFMYLFSKAKNVDEAIEKALQKNQPLEQAAKRSAYTYLASFVLACLAVAGSVSLGNYLTRRGTKHDARQLELREQFLKLSQALGHLPFALKAPRFMQPNTNSERRLA